MQNRNTAVSKCVLNRGRCIVSWPPGGAAAPPATPLPITLLSRDQNQRESNVLEHDHTWETYSELVHDQ